MGDKQTMDGRLLARWVALSANGFTEGKEEAYA